MQITQEIEKIHQENLKSLRIKWIILLILSQFIWALIFIFNHAGNSPAQKLKNPTKLPPLKTNLLRLELPLLLYFPLKEKAHQVVIHHPNKKNLLSGATLYQHTSAKKNHYIVDIPKENLKNLLPLPQFPLEAYPDKSSPRPTHQRKSYEIIY